jgi:hypothetical protein
MLFEKAMKPLPREKNSDFFHLFFTPAEGGDHTFQVTLAPQSDKLLLQDQGAGARGANSSSTAMKVNLVNDTSTTCKFQQGAGCTKAPGAE